MMRIILNSNELLQVIRSLRTMNTKRTNLLPLAAAIGLSATQVLPADTFRERLAQDETLTASDIDSEFATPGNRAWYERFSFGSYGEAHFNTGDVDDMFDIHRLILFTAYEFNDRFRFVSELELEHLYSNNPGTDIEWELEQAYFELDLGNQYQLQAGAILVPLGITNEIHEPTTFYGVERNRVETEIIPSTWTEYGFLLRKSYDGGLQWDFAVHRGIEVQRGDFNLNGPDIRNGRQKTDSFHNGAATARVKYTGIAGLELAAGVQYQDDISRAPRTMKRFSPPLISSTPTRASASAAWSRTGTSAATPRTMARSCPARISTTSTAATSSLPTSGPFRTVWHSECFPASCISKTRTRPPGRTSIRWA